MLFTSESTKNAVICLVCKCKLTQLEKSHHERERGHLSKCCFCTDQLNGVSNRVLMRLRNYTRITNDNPERITLFRTVLYGNTFALAPGEEIVRKSDFGHNREYKCSDIEMGHQIKMSEGLTVICYGWTSF